MTTPSADLHIDLKKILGSASLNGQTPTGPGLSFNKNV
jgi:hypothetical protein